MSLALYKGIQMMRIKFTMLSLIQPCDLAAISSSARIYFDTNNFLPTFEHPRNSKMSSRPDPGCWARCRHIQFERLVCRQRTKQGLDSIDFVSSNLGQHTFLPYPARYHLPLDYSTWHYFQSFHHCPPYLSIVVFKKDVARFRSSFNSSN